MVFDVYRMRCTIFEDEVSNIHLDEEDRFHREDGPAVSTDDAKYYYVHGKLHRLNGPAIITPTARIWCIHGKVSRLDGPAIISKSHGFNGYWVVNGYHVGDKLSKWFEERDMDPQKMSDEEYCILHLTWGFYEGEDSDIIDFDELFIY
jgi:hypothetical protein